MPKGLGYPRIRSQGGVDLEWNYYDVDGHGFQPAQPKGRDRVRPFLPWKSRRLPGGWGVEGRARGCDSHFRFRLVRDWSAVNGRTAKRGQPVDWSSADGAKVWKAAWPPGKFLERWPG